MEYNKDTGLIKFPGCPKPWDNLIQLWQQSSVKFYYDYQTCRWVIEEEVDHVPTFRMERSILTMNRHTSLDSFGLLGLSLIDLSNRSVIMTEGVSDYFTAKLLNPESNVLGVTTLGGSVNARCLLLSLFDEFLICSDSDHTGIGNSMRWRKFLKDNSKKVSVYIPEPPHKDITEEFLSNLRFSQSSL